MTGWLSHMATLMDELNSGLGLVLGIIVLLGYGVAFVVGWTTIRIDVKNNDDEIETLRGYSKTHFEEIGKLKTSVAEIDQKLEGHIQEDRRQFDGITALLKENRDNTLDILKHLRNGGK